MHDIYIYAPPAYSHFHWQVLTAIWYGSQTARAAGTWWMLIVGATYGRVYVTQKGA